ncbi:MAG: hypothetical protein GX121_03420, partial [Ignavibacteria bacterium]|nr:hypothetical protein [Ignavibacteria bacterium]
DTWTNVSYIDSLNELFDLGEKDLYDFLRFVSKSSISSAAYLTTMAIRIYYIRKLLKESGSFYLHCDPTMSHYLKIVCDLIFGKNNFKNEIIWERTSDSGSSKAISKKFPSNHDVLLFYVKNKNNFFYTKLFFDYSPDYIEAKFQYDDNDGRGRYRWQVLKTYSKETFENLEKDNRLKKTANSKYYYYKQYLAESKGVRVPDLWKNDDIIPISASSNEALGYPTQKPELLLERIIKASSKKGDLVADFFCGCGTTVAVAERLGRNWIGVDISHLAIRLIKDRLKKSLSPKKQKDFLNKIELFGFPRDIASAKELAESTKQGRFKFQDWIIEVMLRGVSNEKKTADGGYDGYLTFNKTLTERGSAIIEVKSGTVTIKNLREFIQVVEIEKADIGAFVCFQQSLSNSMLELAKNQGYIENYRVDKIQIITVEEILEGKEIKLPALVDNTTFKSAKRSF